MGLSKYLLAPILVFCLCLSCSLSVSASTPSSQTEGIQVFEQKTLDQQVQESLDDYDQSPVQSIADPIEPWNRFWFQFNDIFYTYIANPAYTAWVAVMPKEFRAGIHNFWHNLLFPLRFVNNILQFRFKAAGVEFGHFIVNSTAGFGGLFNLTKNKKTIVPVHPEGEDFGQTLGTWGIGHGFYLVLPFFGPSSAREAIGLVGDYVMEPSFTAGFFINPWYVPTAAQIGLKFNDLDEILPTYFDMKKAAVDPYIMMREAFIKYRAIQVAR